MQLTVPLEAQPTDVLLDALHILHVLFDGIGVIEAEVALPAELLLYAEIDANGFGVAYVQIAVGFGRETGDYLVVFARLKILDDDVLDEIGGGRDFFFHSRPAGGPPVNESYCRI